VCVRSGWSRGCRPALCLAARPACGSLVLPGCPVVPCAPSSPLWAPPRGRKTQKVLTQRGNSARHVPFSPIGLELARRARPRALNRLHTVGPPPGAGHSVCERRPCGVKTFRVIAKTSLRRAPRAAPLVYGAQPAPAWSWLMPRPAASRRPPPTAFLPTRPPLRPRRQKFRCQKTARRAAPPPQSGFACAHSDECIAHPSPIWRRSWLERRARAWLVAPRRCSHEPKNFEQIALKNCAPKSRTARRRDPAGSRGRLHKMKDAPHRHLTMIVASAPPHEHGSWRRACLQKTKFSHFLRQNVCRPVRRGRQPRGSQPPRQSAP
jgi:hypothetical protein